MRPFELLDEHGRGFPSSQLEGRVLVFAFIDPQCDDAPCQQSLEWLDRLQKSFKGAGPTVKLITLNARPHAVSAPDFAAFISRLNPPSKMWFFLTGPVEDVHSFAADNMAWGAQAEDLPSLARRNAWILVDQAGNIRGRHEVKTSVDLNQVVGELAVLINTTPQTNSGNSPKSPLVAKPVHTPESE